MALWTSTWVVCCIAGAAAAVLSSRTLAADGPKSLSAEDFARPPAVDLVRIAPDGSRFAARAERQGQLVLVVVDMATKKARVYKSDRGSDLESFRWLSDDLIGVRTYKLGVRAFDLSARDFQPAYVSVDGKSRINAASAARALRRVPGSSTDFIAERGVDGYGSVQWEVIDSRDGQVKRLLTGEPPGPMIYRWVLGPDLEPRAAVGYDVKSRKDQIWVRDSSKAPWRLLMQYDERRERGFFPVAVDADGELLVLSNLATGRYALHKLDNGSGTPGELLLGHPQVDIGSGDLIFEAGRLALAGVAVRADRTRFYWFDQHRADVQRTIDASLPGGSVNRLQFLSDGRVLVHAESDVEPGTYYFFDPKARSITEWARSRPWLPPDQMSRTEVFRYRTSDGLEIQSYLTWPRSVARDAAAPLLVWVHGGPHSRDHWEFDLMVQYLASRGYAVLQPNFRGSTGFGRDFEVAGYKQWGRKMQDDVTEGVRALVQQGRVDVRRICIGGSSYGGYAALMGVVREPDLFRCAVDIAGPTDLIWSVESPQADYNRLRGSYRDREIDDALKTTEGDPDNAEDRKVMEANSPRLQARRIKAPVLLIYGTDDWRVPLKHGTAMRDAMQDAGGTHEWKSYAGEGHGVWDRANQIDLMQRVDQFVGKHIGMP